MPPKKKKPATAADYCDAVLSGKIVACKWVKAACQRHVDDLARDGTKGFPYHYDEEQARRAVGFIEQLSHTKGKWAVRKPGVDNRIKLEPSQVFIVSMIFGWRRDDGFRRFRRAYIEEARKNAKTTLAAGIANYIWWGDQPREAGSEIYFGATKQEQAALAWREARMQIERHPVLKKLARAYESKQVIVKTSDPAARMRPLGRDSKTEDGLNPAVAIIDEYHAHQDSALLDVLESGMGARDQPLTLIITTAGLDKSGPCYQQEHQLAEQMLGGTLKPKPEDFFAIVYTLDDGDDWTDPRVWIKANPLLGVSVDPDFIASRVKLAIASPAKANEVRTKNLNVWTQAATRWITDEAWQACGAKFDFEAMRGRHCTVGMDLSSTTDLTALCFAFRPEKPGEKWRFLWRFFAPMDNVAERERVDRVPYSEWIDQGLVIATPGNVVDYDYIEQELRNAGQEFVIDEIVYDPWRSSEIVNHLSPEFTMVAARQAYNPMAIYSDTFEKKILGREVEHDGNPIARWMMSCTEVKSDRQGNIMPMKPLRGTYGKRIDGIVAAIMALGRASIVAEAAPSVYEERGALVL